MGVRPHHSLLLDSISLAGCLPDLQSQTAQENFRPGPVTFFNHDSTTQERHSGIQRADMFMLDGIGDAVAVE